MFWNQIDVVVAQHCEGLNAAGLFTLQWLLLPHRSLTSIKNKKHAPPPLGSWGAAGPCDPFLPPPPPALSILHSQWTVKQG